jgi:hypothetical protein
MTLLKRTIVAVFALLVAAGAAHARALTEAERASLLATVERYEAALQAEDAEAIVLSIPPRLIAYMAEQQGTATDEFLKIIVGAWADAFKSMAFESFNMDVANAEHRELADGTPYVFIATSMIGSVNGKRYSITENTVGIIDDGVWYLLRLATETQIGAFRAVYPGFADVEFPPEKSEAL